MEREGKTKPLPANTHTKNGASHYFPVEKVEKLGDGKGNQVGGTINIPVKHSKTLTTLVTGLESGTTGSTIRLALSLTDLNTKQ